MSRRDGVILAALLALALLVRLLAWPHQSIVTVDGTSYIRLAKELLGGPSYDTVQPPGYPVLMMPLLVAIGGEGVEAARITALLAGLASVALFWWLGRRWIGRWSGVAVGVGIALTPILIRSSIITMSEMPYLLLAGLAVLAAANGRYLTGGLLGGLAFHVRPEGMILVGAMVILSGMKRRAAGWLMAGLVVAGLAPALWYNHAQSGRWSLTRKDTNIIADTPVRNESIKDPAATEQAEKSFTTRLTQFGLESLRIWPARFLAELRHLGHAVGWPVVLLALSGVVMVFGRSDPGRRRLAVAGLIQLLFVPFFGGVAPVPRLIVPVLPFTLLLAVLAMAGLIGARRRLGLAVAGVVTAVWLLAAIPEARQLRLQEDGYYPELVRAGRELAGRISPDALILDRKPYTAFYAGTRYAQVPFGNYHATIEAVQRMQGDFLVVDEAVAEVFRPDLLPLVRDSFTMLNEAQLDPIWFDPSLVRRHTAIYRIIRPGGMPSPLSVDEAEQLRRMISRVPHEPGLHVLHAELLWLQGRRAEALSEYDAAWQAGLLRPGDEERRRRLVAELTGVDSTRAGR